MTDQVHQGLLLAFVLTLEVNMKVHEAQTHRLKEKRHVRIVSPLAVLREGSRATCPQSLWVEAEVEVEAETPLSF